MFLGQLFKVHLSAAEKDALKEYIEETYRETDGIRYSKEPKFSKDIPSERFSKELSKNSAGTTKPEVAYSSNLEAKEIKHSSSRHSNHDVEKLVSTLEDTFSVMLLKKIDEKGMSDAQCYKKAGLDRKLFSKIRSDENYKPSKKTALALAIALELTKEETNQLLKKAGFSLSHSILSDVIIEYFIEKRIFDMYIINSTLLEYDQQIL